MSAILVLFHCESNPGFAASSHEHTFLKVAQHFVGDYSRIHYAYTNLEDGITPSLPEELTNIVQIDTRWTAKAQLDWIEAYVKQHAIDKVLGFDQPVRRPAYKALRRGGVREFVSYWGAPMSSINRGLKLVAKRIEVSLSRNGPDFYVFQSEGMRDSAVKGRGIPHNKTTIVKTGIDTEKYSPEPQYRHYVFDEFGIPKDRKIVVFSGHMAKRKGVHIILQSADELVNALGERQVHFLILGNKPGQEEVFAKYLENDKVREHVTFGGYRNDIPRLLKGCSVGMIASTGWDSFPMSSLEMAATELPLLVSDLPGLREAVTADTGVLFPSGDFKAAAKVLHRLINDDPLRSALGAEGRRRVEKYYSRESQAQGLIDAFNRLSNPSSGT